MASGPLPLLVPEPEQPLLEDGSQAARAPRGTVLPFARASPIANFTYGRGDQWTEGWGESLRSTWSLPRDCCRDLPPHHICMRPGGSGFGKQGRGAEEGMPAAACTQLRAEHSVAGSLPVLVLLLRWCTAQPLCCTAIPAAPPPHAAHPPAPRPTSVHPPRRARRRSAS